MKNRLAKIILI